MWLRDIRSDRITKSRSLEHKIGWIFRHVFRHHSDSLHWPVMDKFFAPSPGNSGGERGHEEEEEEVAVTGERQGATLVRIGFFEVNPVTKTGKRRGQNLIITPLYKCLMPGVCPVLVLGGFCLWLILESTRVQIWCKNATSVWCLISKWTGDHLWQQIVEPSRVGGGIIGGRMITFCLFQPPSFYPNPKAEAEKTRHAFPALVSSSRLVPFVSLWLYFFKVLITQILTRQLRISVTNCRPAGVHAAHAAAPLPPHRGPHRAELRQPPRHDGIQDGVCRHWTQSWRDYSTRHLLNFI